MVGFLTLKAGHRKQVKGVLVVVVAERVGERGRSEIHHLGHHLKEIRGVMQAQVSPQVAVAEQLLLALMGQPPLEVLEVLERLIPSRVHQ